MILTVFRPTRGECRSLLVGVTWTTVGSPLEHYSDGRVLHYTYLTFYLLAFRMTALIQHGDPRFAIRTAQEGT